MSLSVYLYKNDPSLNILDEDGEREEELYRGNITHNLNIMAQQVDIYKCLWRPEEINIFIAKDLIKPLEKGLLELKKHPKKYKKFDSPNGWGLYIHFVPFVEKYLNACKNYPDAFIEVSR